MMKKIFLLVILSSAYFFTAAQAKLTWTCPMHPKIQKEGPGKCPICGMNLVKQTDSAKPPENVPAGHDMHQMAEHEMHTDTAGPAIPDQVQSRIYAEPGKTVRYDLFVKDTMVNFTGRQKPAIAINGSIPAPILSFTEGDTAEIYLHNELHEETSLHWHGVILPNQADGVPYLTTKRIGPGETHLYKFKVVQNGTYWYHSHSSLQEQSGMYGALLFRPQAPETSSDNQEQADQHMIHHDTMVMKKSGAPKNALFNKEYTVVLSEWTDENPMQVQRRLRTANDWYAIKKGSTQSYVEAIREGHFKTKLSNEWKRMKAMDVSDVYYDRFLINGKPSFNEPGFKAGDKINLKVVNAGASSYFWLGYAGGKITVVGNDGNDMEPVDVDRLIIAPSETYDLVVTVPGNMSYEFRATAEDRAGYSSLWLGTGHQMQAPTLKRLKYFEGMKMMNSMMRVNGKMNDMGMQMSNQKMDMNSVMYPEMTEETSSDTVSNHLDNEEHAGHNMSMGASGMITLNYDMLRSPLNTSLPEDRIRILHFTLTGNMNRYVWTLDNKTVKEADRILINKGEVLRLVIANNSMMRHPMHLHGHDFRVVNSQGDYSPLKNVIDIMPMETDTIEFAANQTGNWFFHCHILFHMMAGMGRVFAYNNSPVNSELPDAEKAYHRFRRHKDQNMYHFMVRAALESNGSDGEAMLSSNRYALQGLWHMGTQPHHGHEGEIWFGRYLGPNQWWYPYIGYDYHYKKEEGDMTNAHDYKNMFGQVSNKNNRSTFTVGIQYTTPWLLLADARLDGDGKFRFQLSREDIPVTSRLRFSFMGNTDREYMVGLRYILSKWFALSSHYDSDMGLGAGITVTY
jgi:FtsP/CotA-like multicopper oxidase with cupredoxin domain